MAQAQAFFLPAAPGQRWCIFHPPQGVQRGCVVYVHPFAEELNKTRRMAALQARAMSEAGLAVLQIDLLGCGDSSGDFGDARWETWVQDVLLACRWLRQRPDVDHAMPLWLWGLRTGCLLAAQAARELPEDCHLLFWQPVTSGAVQLHQYLRLRLAADMVAGAAKGAVDAMRAELARGEPVDIAGYTLAPPLAGALEHARLAPPPPTDTHRRLVWLELSRAQPPAMSPAAIRGLEEWKQAGWQAEDCCVHGPAFWQSVETEVVPALLGATLDALCLHG